MAKLSSIRLNLKSRKTKLEHIVEGDLEDPKFRHGMVFGRSEKTTLSAELDNGKYVPILIATRNEDEIYTVECRYQGQPEIKEVYDFVEAQSKLVLGKSEEREDKDGYHPSRTG